MPTIPLGAPINNIELDIRRGVDNHRTKLGERRFKLILMVAIMTFNPTTFGSHPATKYLIIFFEEMYMPQLCYLKRSQYSNKIF
jgi:hypothetical protein